jgi:hypothetical protein
MGNLRAVLSASLLTFAACGDDGGTAKPDAPVIHLDAAIDVAPDSPPLPDAPSYDFSCLNNSAPTTVAANVTVSGTAQEIVLNGTTPSIQANPNVSVKACKGDCLNANNLGTTTSSSTGAYTTMSLTTNGTALDGYLDATKSTDRRTLVYPPSPLAADQGNVPLLMFSTSAFSALNQFLLNPMQSPNNGLVGIIVTDCMNTPITTGATVGAKQNGTAVGDAPLDLGSLAAQGAGTYLITNVPPGNTEVSATVQGMTFRAHIVNSVAGATTTTGVRPGF